MTKLSSAEEERILKENEGLVWSVVRRFGGRDEREDLYQLGAIGLLAAARGFDPQRGTAFSTYAVPFIAGEIRRHLRDHGPVKVSRALRELGAKAAAVRASLMQASGEEPRLSDIAEKLGLPPEEIAAAETALIRPASLEADTGEGGSLADCLAAGEDTAESAAERVDLSAALQGLSRSERAVIRLRYASALTQTQTANLLGMSQVQVSRTERRILRKLRERMQG